MNLLRVLLHIFMYVVVVCPISEVVCVSHRGLQEHAVNSGKVISLFFYLLKLSYIVIVNNGLPLTFRYYTYL